jgi:hypothetical protein
MCNGNPYSITVNPGLEIDRRAAHHGRQLVLPLVGLAGNDRRTGITIKLRFLTVKQALPAHGEYWEACNISYRHPACLVISLLCQRILQLV